VRDRLFGVETEYAMVVPGGRSRGRDDLDRTLVRRVSDTVPSVSDGSRGLFCGNGSRFYVDVGHHPEWATPEVANPWDLVRYTLAGERLLAQVTTALRMVEWAGAEAVILKSNVDYASRVTWGCHESVAVREHPLGFLSALLPFLVSRVVLTGAGGFTCGPGLEFRVSPRAQFLSGEASSESTWQRGVFHTKDEPLAAHGYRRLHVICGESLCSELGMWLRGATLVLVVALAESGWTCGPGVMPQDPEAAFQAFSLDAERVRRIPLVCGTSVTACELQRVFLDLARAHLSDACLPPWAAEACGRWDDALTRLERDDATVPGTFDWAIKHALFTRHLERRGFTWSDVSTITDGVQALWRRLDERCALEVDDWSDQVGAVLTHADALADTMALVGLDSGRLERFQRVRHELFALDARFSQLGEGSLFGALDATGVLAHHVPGVDNIAHAMTHPPDTGRAKVRGEVITRVQDVRERFCAGWDFVLDRLTRARLDLSNPLERDERWSTTE
jgi:proteasome accessory factor A